ncbi:ribbon-helix-helix domain-containing protein [Rhodohalobacter halophilus]|uniref:ribbon-helix-helix domain-containing protein n=1 Tax=Rhodohalobacter halophilus TaxID=1812810 RepID=UPI00083F7D06|nr:ribbon-helix-helix domain-containing protein [Rhodohalobacter halophilus]
MKSVRLPKEIEEKLDSLSTSSNKSHSQIIREALVEYIAKEEQAVTPYDAGKDLFGKRGSGEADRSINYKSRIKEKIREQKSN